VNRVTLESNLASVLVAPHMSKTTKHLARRGDVSEVVSYIPWLYRGLGLDKKFQQIANYFEPIPEDEEYSNVRNSRNKFISQLYDHLEPVHKNVTKFKWLDDLEQWGGKVLSGENVIKAPGHDVQSVVYANTTKEEPVFWNPGGI
jgi:hypothetical protein